MSFYGSVADMVARFGEAEMIRLTTPQGQELSIVQADPIVRALTEASATIDSYCRKRYATPLASKPGEVLPPEITRACAHLARYDLSTGDQKEPSEQVRLSRKEVIGWLEDIADGRVLLDLTEVDPGDDSYAQVQTRQDVFRDPVTSYGFGTPGRSWP